MISKKDLEDYEFLTICGYFDYIVNSRVNGNFRQVNDLIKALSKAQYSEFIRYALVADKHNIKYYIKDEQNIYAQLLIKYIEKVA